MESVQTVGPIDALLPQTQCGRCGFESCRPYAEAIRAGWAHINLCYPGGETTIQALAMLLGVPPRAPDRKCGDFLPNTVARVEEHWCLGCTRCLAVCPVDAIVGARGQMHTVIAEECTGCERCIVQCPVDCIQMIPRDAVDRGTGPNVGVAVIDGAHGIQRWPGGWTRSQADRARRRFQERQLRLQTRRLKRAADHERKRKWLRSLSREGSHDVIPLGQCRRECAPGATSSKPSASE